MLSYNFRYNSYHTHQRIVVYSLVDNYLSIHYCIHFDTHYYNYQSNYNHSCFGTD
nr:hypothetical protein [uncultured Prevotella sp.]